MRRYLLGAFAALVIALVVTAQPSSSLRHFKVWDETTSAAAPCNQNKLVAKCSAAANYSEVTRNTLGFSATRTRSTSPMRGTTTTDAGTSNSTAP